MKMYVVISDTTNNFDDTYYREVELVTPSKQNAVEYALILQNDHCETFIEVWDDEQYINDYKPEQVP